MVCKANCTEPSANDYSQATQSEHGKESFSDPYTRLALTLTPNLSAHSNKRIKHIFKYRSRNPQ